MQNHKIKVGYYLEQNTKDAIDKVKHLGMKPNEVLDRLFRLDQDSIDIFIKLVKSKNLSANQDYIPTNQGGLVTNPEFMKKIHLEQQSPAEDNRLKKMEEAIFQLQEQISSLKNQGPETSDAEKVAVLATSEEPKKDLNN